MIDTHFSPCATSRIATLYAHLPPTDMIGTPYAGMIEISAHQLPPFWPFTDFHEAPRHTITTGNSPRCIPRDVLITIASPVCFSHLETGKIVKPVAVSLCSRPAVFTELETKVVQKTSIAR